MIREPSPTTATALLGACGGLLRCGMACIPSRVEMVRQVRHGNQQFRFVHALSAA
jgi:hypothetical protein